MRCGTVRSCVPELPGVLCPSQQLWPGHRDIGGATQDEPPTLTPYSLWVPPPLSRCQQALFGGFFQSKQNTGGDREETRPFRLLLSNAFTTVTVWLFITLTNSRVCKRLDDPIAVAASWKSLDVSARGLLPGWRTMWNPR